MSGASHVVDPRQTEPGPRFGIVNRDIVGTRDLLSLERVALTSDTFAKAHARLDRLGVRVVREVAPLPGSTGGGRTSGSRRHKSYRIEIWPPVVFAGIHVLDVLIHEFGHVVEDFSSVRMQTFLNTVQKELGIRTTHPSHPEDIKVRPIDRSGRDPFRRP